MAYPTSALAQTPPCHPLLWLCTDGTLSDPALVLPTGFGTCGSFNHFVAIANQTDCDLAHISGEAWFCGCAGVEPPDDIDAFLNPFGNVTFFNDDFFAGNVTMQESNGKKKMKKEKKEEHKMDKKLKKKGTRRLFRSGEIPEVIARQGGRVRGGYNVGCRTAIYNGRSGN